MSLATEVTKVLRTRKTVFAEEEDAATWSAVLVMVEDYVYDLRLWPVSEHQVARTLMAIRPAGVELEVGDDVSMRAVNRIEDQLAASGVRHVEVRWPIAEEGGGPLVPVRPF